MSSRDRDLVDRTREWDTLQRCAASDRPELVRVMGRRRVGKSFLLARFVDRHDGIYYQATRRSEADQLRALSQCVGQRHGDEGLQRGAAFADWESLLHYLAARARREPILLVIDEFPYLADVAPALPSILQSAWDHEFVHGNITVVLCGSFISSMKRLTGGDQPLHGRRTAQLMVRPFGHDEAAEFARGWSPRDRLRAHAVFGGLPGQLALIEAKDTLEDNVVRHVIDPRGRLFDEASHVLDAFLREATVHYAIVDAIAGGNHTWSRIASRVGKDSASLSRPLKWLQDMSIVETVAPVSRRRKPSPKLVRYRLADPYLRFWHRYIAPLQVDGTAELVDATTIWRTMIEPHLDGLMGEVFEDACRRFVARQAQVNPDQRLLPFTPIQVGAWWDGGGDHEIDVVAVGSDGELLLGECKWGSVDRHDLQQLESHLDAALRSLPTARTVHLALFTGDERMEMADKTGETGSMDPGLQERVASGDVLLFGLGDVFGGE